MSSGVSAKAIVAVLVHFNLLLMLADIEEISGVCSFWEKRKC